MIYARFPLPLRNVADLQHERGIEIGYETARFWSQCFGPMFPVQVCRNPINCMRSASHWQLYERLVRTRLTAPCR